MADMTYSEPEIEGIDVDAAESLFYHEAGLKATWAVSRLSVAALSFLFGAFLFAYFYLKSINSDGLWHPSHAVQPHAWAGAAVMGLVVASAVVQTVALRRIKAGNKATWQQGAGVALALGVGAFGVMIWQLATLPFAAGASGFDSTFTAYTPVYLVLTFGMMVWLEVLLARSRAISAVHFVEQPPAYADTFALQQFQARLSAFTVVWNYLAAIAILFWVLFYLI